MKWIEERETGEWNRRNMTDTENRILNR